LPLDFAAAISGLEAVLPLGAVEADFLAVLPALVADAGAAAAGTEVAGAGVAVGVAEAFWLLPFAIGAVDVLAAGAEEVAGSVASAVADFLLLLLFLVAVVSDVPAALAGAADAAVESALADFLPLFCVVVLSDEPAAPAEVEVWSDAPVPEDFFLDFDVELEEASVLTAPELAVSDSALFVDFLLEEDDFVSLAAAA
jgi:hypothetical protein